MVTLPEKGKLARPAKRLTNVQFIKRQMEYSKNGALMQAFILEACSKYAKACAEADASVFDSPLLSGNAWKACAIELRDALESHLKG